MTEDELLQALLEEYENREQEEAGGFTTSELAARLNCGEEKARRVIRSLVESGRVVPTRVRRVSILTGMASKRFGYQVVQAGE